MVVQACDPSTQEVEAVGHEFKFSIQHKPHGNTIAQKNQTKTKCTPCPQINQYPEKDQVQGQSQSYKSAGSSKNS